MRYSLTVRYSGVCPSPQKPRQRYVHLQQQHALDTL